MHLKFTKSKQHTYLQIVESYRDENGVPRHKVLFNLGRLETLKADPSFHRVIDKIKEVISSAKPNNMELEEISEAEIIKWGHKIYEKIWKSFGINEILDSIKSETKAKFDLNTSCFRMAIEHLLEPKSKNGVYSNQDKYYDISNVDLHHLYRSLDILSENKEILEKEIFNKHRNIFNMNVDIVFYDVTTFHFESVKGDGFREFGYSKNGKFNEVQIVMGLLIDMEGRPIGYELFSGNTFDGKTLSSSLDKLKERFNINKVIIVADRGINSKLNLKLIKDKGYDYIVASRIKNLPSDIQKEIFLEEGYKVITEKKEISETNSEEEDLFKLKVINYENKVKDFEGRYHILPEKLIITYSSRRAKKDKEDRLRLIEKAHRLAENSSLIKSDFKRGGRKYLKSISEKQLKFDIDEEAIIRDEMFDGYYGIQTSEKKLSELEIISAYHKLWKIEESFRIMKSNLEVRPIFHWTEKRIKGHFVICFLAFLLERTLEYKLKRANIKASPIHIREAINEMRFAKFESKGQTYYLKTKINSLGSQILRLMKISPPKNLSKPDELIFKI